MFAMRNVFLFAALFNCVSALVRDSDADISRHTAGISAAARLDGTDALDGRNTTSVMVEITRVVTKTSDPLLPRLGDDNLPLATRLSERNGLDEASSCNAAKWSWVSNRGQTHVSNSVFKTSSTSISFTVINRSSVVTSLADPTPYTLCDGYPRLNGTTTVESINTTPHRTITSYFTTTSPVYQNVSAPTCVIPSDECAALQSEYTSSHSAYISSLSHSKYDAKFPTSPICGSPTLPTPSYTTLGHAACAVNAASLQLLYWPVTTVSGDLCKQDGTTLTATPTITGQPNTAIYQNQTLTSPTVYMAFKGLYTLDSNNDPITSLKQSLLPLAPSAISSRCAQLGGGFGPPQQVNYADFNHPVPASAYRCQTQCVTPNVLPPHATQTLATENLCSTIYNDYNPVLAIPTEFASAFSSVAFDDVVPGLPCSFILDDLNSKGGVFWDPPIALQEVSTVAGPSIPRLGPATTTKDGGQEQSSMPGQTAQAETMNSALQTYRSGSEDKSDSGRSQSVSAGFHQPVTTSNSDPSDPNALSPTRPHSPLQTNGEASHRTSSKGPSQTPAMSTDSEDGGSSPETITKSNAGSSSSLLASSPSTQSSISTKTSDARRIGVVGGLYLGLVALCWSVWGNWLV